MAALVLALAIFVSAVRQAAVADLVGGEYRRLLSATGSDHKSMMRARAEIAAAFNEGRTKRGFNQFNQICHSHQDYMWDILTENP